MPTRQLSHLLLSIRALVKGRRPRDQYTTMPCCESCRPATDLAFGGAPVTLAGRNTDFASLEFGQTSPPKRTAVGWMRGSRGSPLADRVWRRPADPSIPVGQRPAPYS